jgi:protein-disulfide isomerase
VLGGALAVVALAGVVGALVYTGAFGKRGADDEASPKSKSIEKVESEPKPKRKPPKRAEALPLLDTDPTRGPDDAIVTLVEFGDLDDPLTAGQEKAVSALLTKYDKKLRLVWKDFPLAWHKESMRAAVLARVAQSDGGPTKFWELHDDALAHRGKAASTLTEWEKKLDPELRARADKQANALVGEGLTLAKSLKVSVGATFFLDGELIKGGRAPLEKAIDAHVVEAEKLLAEGVPRADLYATMVERHFAEAPPAGIGLLYELDLAGATELGAAAAPATVVVFGDLDAPALGVRPVLAELAKSPDVRLVWRDRPSTYDGRQAALVVRAIGAKAGAGKQAEAIDAIWAMRSGSSPTALDRPALKALAKGYGLTDADVEAALKDPKALAAIEDDLGQAETIDAGGPANVFFVNGRRLHGGTRHDLEAAIAWASAIGNKRLAAGVAPKDLYAELTAGAMKSKKRTATLTPPKGAYAKGAAAGPGVEIVQLFFDLEDTKTRALLLPGGVLERFLRAHPGEVRLVFRHLPATYRPSADLAAELVLEAAAERGEAGFFRAIDDVLKPTRLDVKALDAVVTAEGLDAAKVKDAQTTHKYKPIIDADVTAARGAGIYAAPTLVTGEELVHGAGATVVSLEAALGRAKRRATR